MMKRNDFEHETEMLFVLLDNAGEEGTESVITTYSAKLFLDIVDDRSRLALMRKLASNYWSKKHEDALMFVMTAGDIAACEAIPDAELKKLFYCLVVQKKLHPHSSGWVRLDWPAILTIAFEDYEAKKIKIERLSDLRPYGMDMRVIGSKNPVLCFSIPDFATEEVVAEQMRKDAKDFFLKEFEHGGT